MFHSFVRSLGSIYPSLTYKSSVPDQASTEITKEFLNTGILPQTQDSGFVTVYAPGTTRKPIADPYGVPTGPLAGDIDSGVTVEIPY